MSEMMDYEDSPPGVAVESPPDARRRTVNRAVASMPSTVADLTAAIDADNVKALEEVLARHPCCPLDAYTLGPYETRTGLRRFPLPHYAARQGSLASLQHLVGRGMDVNKHTRNGGTPISRAVQSGRSACVAYLLRSGCDVNRRVTVCMLRECRVNLVTPLMIAVSRDQPGIVRQILDCGRCEVNATAGLNESALYFALKYSQRCNEYVSMLLDAGCDPNISSISDEPPLILAMKHGQIDVAKLFIQKGCNVNATNASPGGCGMTALHYAAEMDNSELVLALAAAGANLNSKLDPNSTLGCAPLLQAVSGRKSYGAMAALISAGCDVTTSDKFGRGLCHWLVLNGDEGMLSSILLRHPAINPDTRSLDSVGATPLYFATLMNNTRAIKTLLRRNCRADLTFGDGNLRETLMEMALKRGFPDSLALLYAAGCPLPANLSSCLARDTGVHAAIRHDKTTLEWLRHVTSTPRSLLEISALNIRASLSCDIGNEVKQLHLPGVMKDFLVYMA